MKHVLYLSISLMILLGASAFAANIGENFEAGGIAISGSGSFYTNFDGYWSVGLHPDVEFALVDNLTFVVGADANLYYDESDNYFGLFTGIAYQYPLNPGATQGFALEARANLYVNYTPSADYLSVWITPVLRGEYFIAPRIAPFVSLSAVSIRLSDGFYASTYLNVSFGIAYFLAAKEKAMFPRGNR